MLRSLALYPIEPIGPSIFYFSTTAGFEPARQFANRLVIYRLRPLGQVVFVSFRRSNNSTRTCVRISDTGN